MEVYIYIIGRRTQVTLREEQHDFLSRESARSGLSLAELVRRALDTAYDLRPRARVKGYELSVAVWREPDAAIVGRELRRKSVGGR